MNENAPVDQTPNDITQNPTPSEIPTNPIIDNSNTPIKPKTNKFTILETIFIFALLSTTGLYIFLNLKSDKNKSLPSPEVITQDTTSTPAQKTYLETYTDTKLGYTIKYPSSLGISIIEGTPKQDYLQYVEDCETGKIDGCGGSRYPDFRKYFMINDTYIFSISVYQLPVVDFGLADLVRDNFSYEIFGFNGQYDKILSSYPDLAWVTEDNLLSQFEFIEPDLPLSCLWDTTLAGFEPDDDREYIRKYIEENKENLSLYSGYFVNPSTNKCEFTEIYAWGSEENNDIPPFSTLEECLNTCTN